MRAVSPVVAVVIMIAATVITAVFLSTWVMKEVSDQTSTNPQCAVHTSYEIESAKFKSSLNETRVVVVNKGAESIYGFSLQVENGTDIQTVGVVESPETSSSSGLSRGRSVFLTYTSIGSFNQSLGLTMTWLKVMNAGCPEVFAETRAIEQIS
jgi:flagellin-like protein